MAEFAVKMTLSADNRGFTPPVEEAKRQLRDLGKAATGTTTTQTGLAASATQSANAQKRHATALNVSAQAARAGTLPAQILGQAIAQIGVASVGTTGKLGSMAGMVGRGGAWGTAVSLGILALGYLVTALFDTEDASKKAAKGLDIHKMSAEELTKAIDDQNEALGKSIQTSKQAEQQAYANARALLDETLKRRDNIQTLLEERKVRLEGSSDALRFGGTPDQMLNVGIAAAGLRDIEKRLAANAADIAKAQTGVRLADIPRMAREVEVATDKLAAAEDRHADIVAELNKQLKLVGVNRAAIRAQMIAEEKRYNKETEAIRESTKARKENNAEVGRSLSSNEAASLIRAAGGRVTDQDRTFTEQKRLYDRYLAGGNLAAKPGTGPHEQGRALDIGGLSAAKIKDIFREAGVRITALRKYADGHIHVAWAKSAAEAKLFNEQLREQKEKAREAERALLDLQRTLDDITRRFDPAAAAANDYAQALADIDKLAKAGTIGLGQQITFGTQAFFGASDADLKAKNEQMARWYTEEFGETIEETLAKIGVKTGEIIADSFGDRASDLAYDIGDIIGGQLGDVIDSLGSILANFDPNSKRSQEFDKLGDNFGKLLKDGIGISETASKAIGKSVGGALKGYDTGAQVAQIGKMIWGKFSTTGSKIGGTAGGLLSAITGIPGLDIIGSIIGGTIGGLFKKTKHGSTTITDAYGGLTGVGNNSKYKDAAVALGGNVQSGLQSIAEALGGTLGSFAVSIGTRKKKFVVDPSGRGRTKGSGVLKFDDEADAIAAALRDAIADGAVKGLSAAVQRALTSSSDLNKALNEALKVQDLETLLEGIGGAIGAEFKAFDRIAAERVRIATKYGFDLVKLEKFNAEQRAKIFDEILGASIGALKDLLDDINFGGLFEGSAIDRLAKLRTEADKATADLAAGIEGSGDRLAALNRDILELSRETFGTAGGEFASDRAAVISATERAIELERKRIEEAAGMVAATNSLLDENNAQNAQIISQLGFIAAAVSGGTTTGTGQSAPPSTTWVGQLTQQ